MLLLLCTASVRAASAALGIDFGTEYIKAAIAKPGSPIEIVLTKDSKRKEAAALAFKPSRSQLKDKNAYPERLYGGDALAVSARYPTDTYINLKSLLGLSYDSPAVATYARRFPGVQIAKASGETDRDSSVAFKSQSFPQSDPFMVEELLGMELKNIKANAEATVGNSNFVQDVVITYPAYYTAEEKRALELAADLAGLNLLGLISDGQAVGLNYATARTAAPEPEYHVVYDMGAGSTTSSVLKFHNKNIKGPGRKNQTVQEVQVVGIGYDRSLGGDALNDVIVQDMVAKFLETPKIKTMGVEDVHVRKDSKSMARLWKDAEKVRQILSANAQASASFEGFYYEDVSFKYKLTRPEFEALASMYASRVAEPLSAALSMAGMTLDDISSVILFGGMTRTPFVQSQLEKAVGDARKVKANVNADEAAALGAAFQAASLSPSFRVKDIRVADIAGHAYTMKWISNGKEKQQRIFLETSSTGVVKQVNINHMDSSIIQFEQASADQDTPHKVLEVDATNITKSVNELKTSYGCADSNITTTFNVRLSPVDGLPEIVSGSVGCIAQKAKEGSVMDNVKGMFGFGKKDDPKPLADEIAGEQEIVSQTPAAVHDPTSSGSVVSDVISSSPSSASSSSVSSASSVSAKQMPSSVMVPLALKGKVVGGGVRSAAAVPGIKQRLSAFDASDKNSMLRAEALNVLEAFTYRARDYLEDESFISFSTDAVRAELEKQLSATSEWLYGDGVDAQLEDFKGKLKSLKQMVEPVLKRRDEAGKRRQAVEALDLGLKSATSVVDMIKSSVEKAAHDAASSIGNLASSASEDVSSVLSSVTGGDDLEDEPYSNVENESGAAQATETALPKLYEYTQEDLTMVQKAYHDVKAWLEEKLALQEKLAPSDEPAVLVAELEAKSRELQTTISDLVMKQIRQTPPKSKKTKKPRTSKSTKVRSEATAHGDTTTTSSTTTSTIAASVTTKDEL